MCVCLSTAILYCLVYQQRQSEELLALLPRTESDSNHINDRSPYAQVLTIPAFQDESENADIQNTEDIDIDAASEMELERRLPNALVIGIRKGGTRAVLDFLSRHPSVRVCQKEVHFFDRQDNYLLGLDWYRQQMPLSYPNQTTIEKTPAYFVTNNVPYLVFKMSPSIKLLVVVRDPTVRAISDYAQLFEKSNGTLAASFEEYITEDHQHQILRKTRPAVTIGIYIEHLKKWLDYFPLEQIHFINGEELVTNPVQEMKSVENFLGLKPFLDEKLFYYNETKGFLCLAPATQNKGSHSGCLGESKGRPHPSVSEDVVTLLRDFYRPLNHEFYRTVGRNFGWP